LLTLIAARLRALHRREQAPADLPKEAASFDLPIALGILVGSGQMESELLGQYAVVGELALDGSTRPAKGALSMAMAAAEQDGLRGVMVPSDSAAVVEKVEAIPVGSLAQAIGFLTGQLEIEPVPSRLPSACWPTLGGAGNTANHRAALPVPGQVIGLSAGSMATRNCWDWRCKNLHLAKPSSSC